MSYHSQSCGVIYMYCQVQMQLKSDSAQPSHFIEVQRILAESHISEQSHMDMGLIK